MEQCRSMFIKKRIHGCGNNFPFLMRRSTQYTFPSYPFCPLRYCVLSLLTFLRRTYFPQRNGQHCCCKWPLAAPLPQDRRFVTHLHPASWPIAPCHRRKWLRVPGHGINLPLPSAQATTFSGSLWVMRFQCRLLWTFRFRYAGPIVGTRSGKRAGPCHQASGQEPHGGWPNQEEWRKLRDFTDFPTGLVLHLCLQYVSSRIGFRVLRTQRWTANCILRATGGQSAAGRFKTRSPSVCREGSAMVGPGCCSSVVVWIGWWGCIPLVVVDVLGVVGVDMAGSGVAVSHASLLPWGGSLVAALGC